MEHGGNVWEGSRPEKWLDFSANLRPEGTPDWVKELLTGAISEARYYPDREMKAAREGLAAYAKVKYENILPAAGGIGAIELALRLENGLVRADAPCFGEYFKRASALGRGCAYGTDNCLTGETAIICNPNNPSGGALERNEVLKKCERLREIGSSLIVDEAFIDYCPEISVRGDVKKGLMVVGSLTKILCVPGVRLGYICADEGTISRLMEIMPPWGISAFAAKLASALPDHMDEIALYRRQNDSRRESLIARLSRLGFKPLPSKANFVLCDFGRDMTDAVKYLKSKNILVRDCASFGLGENWLRLAVRTEEENARLIKELGIWLKY